jgi:glycine betaine/choline ABC-type transport system substrate-binding protein
VLQAHPELGSVLELLAGLLDEATMQQLNFDVDEKKRRPAEVARQLLESRGLLGEGG